MLMCAVSCQKENGQENVIKGKEIKIEQGTVLPTKSTPGSAVAEEVLFTIPVVTENGDTLSLVASISDMTDTPAPQTCLTKGAPVTTENLGDMYKSFETTVYKGGSLYTDELGNTMDKVTVTYGTEGWSLVGAPYRWPDETTDLVFCSYAPISAAGVSGLSWNNGTKVTFNYVNTPSGPDTSGDSHDAENQTDIIFAINEQNVKDHDGTALINFSHALVGVKFIKGDIEKCTLQKVTLNNFYSQGSAEGTLNTDGNLDFEWTGLSGLKNYTQSFTGALSFDQLADKALIDPTDDGKYTFLMVPQLLDADASVGIYLHYGGSSDQYLSVNLGSITAEQAGSEANVDKLKDWSAYAGKVITIRINRADLAVAVDETFDGSVKANVGAKNTGGKIEFVRATIVANWVDEDGNICENCDFVHDGDNLAGYLSSGCNWEYNPSDGFYYYSKAIVPGAVTQGKIFTSYTTPEAPEDGLHLEMAVVVQGVEYDSSCAKAKASWSVPDGYLTSEIEYETSGE